MMKGLTITSALFIISLLPAYGDIVSSDYVNDVMDSIESAIDSKAAKTGYSPNSVLYTDNSGELTSGLLQTGLIPTDAVTNSRLASGIGLDKIDVGTLPTSGKHIMIWNAETEKYVFEEFRELAGLQCDAGTYDIGFGSCISASTNGSDRGYWDFGGSTRDTTTYGLTAGGQWGVTFNDYGNVTGIASCNSTSGTYGVATDTEFSNTANGQICWCKMTSPSASRWVFLNVYSADDCANYCANDCAYLVQSNSGFRSGVFGSVGN